MSIKNWNAGIIRPVPVAPAGPFQDGAATGVWTLDQVAYWEQQNLWPTAGNVSPNAFIENLFSTYLYTGNGSSQTITNGIDLSTYGGLVWTKCRNDGVLTHRLNDTVRGITNRLFSNLTNAQSASATSITAVSTTGYTVGSENGFNQSSNTFVSWTFREQPKFFDVVTYTGNGTSGRTVSHNLGSVPGCIIVKQTGGGSTGGVNNWFVYHRSLGGTKYLGLDGTFAAITSSSTWNNTDPTSTVFTIGGTSDCNDNNGTYVAYLFAHNAGGFGLSGSDNVISCGSYTTNGSGNADVTLGYEPQWVMSKGTDAGFGWNIFDTMRGMPVSTDARELNANSSAAETGIGSSSFSPTATGFSVKSFNPSTTYIYIAIRRGPMKTPTSGTSVFSPIVATSGTATTNFPVDLQILSDKGSTNAILNQQFVDRLRGASSTTTQQGVYLLSSSTAAESSAYPNSSKLWSNTGFGIPLNYEGASSLYLSFRRAPGFFDEVCYTGTGSATTVTHNLGVAPELMIVKNRSIVSDWRAYSASLGATQNLKPNTTDAATSSTLIWNDTAPTSSVFTVGTAAGVNGSGNNMVAYLFATCAGVSKVGSYTGTGTTKQIDCGFTGGARFVLIKRTDSTGDWYVWDSARGIVSGNDPYLLLNSTAAEVTGTDYVDTLNAGFEISSTAPAAINANGGTFIFLAIA